MTTNNQGYEESIVLSQIKKKNDIQVQGRLIRINNSDTAKGDIGIKTKGKLDFLSNYCGYFVTNQ